ncbi:N-acetyl-gamma-glutamyl-phosphate reductase [Enhygromyxa salina]|uniref:N-acetyl-gamma-glutamyl-phosphate reductase n=1 Tax=Enhygromyxa salina TaxID=215803 RepID=A0A0C2CZC7_9BACT|nr:Asd/ArgC dimerization domain-containing protein [Enhygromyxa salina]KIG15005.1 N-acetyl-gamma-glutamyl-phosphate reductase [Enhygromyxa salina]
MADQHFKVGIIGASGYAGQVLHALVMQHPCMEAVVPDARTPSDLEVRGREQLAACDVVALALPGEPARLWTDALFGLGVNKILDLSDARRRDPDAHYGLPELFGGPPEGARVVANPGCYPTATLLGLRPLLQRELINPTPIAVLGTSGASGAGKGLADHLHFCNLAGNSFPYKVGEHRHVPEIEHHLGGGAAISFVTQLLPIIRGMIVTSFVVPRASPAQLRDALVQHYAAHPWVSVLEQPDQGLGLGHVVGTHQALLAVGPVERSGLVPVFASIDNLMRGAASQALCNLNLWLGLAPGLGLPAPRVGLPAGVAPAFSTLTSSASSASTNG